LGAVRYRVAASPAIPPRRPSPSSLRTCGQSASPAVKATFQLTNYHQKMGIKIKQAFDLIEFLNKIDPANLPP
jgi:hypothetical protein